MLSISEVHNVRSFKQWRSDRRNARLDARRVKGGEKSPNFGRQKDIEQVDTKVDGTMEVRVYRAKEGKWYDVGTFPIEKEEA